MTDPRRTLVVAEAESWLKTPYAHMQRCKGAGTDCLMLLAEVYERAGIVEHIEVPFYVPDFNLHKSDELYLNGVLKHAVEIDGPPRPGDVAVFRFGRCYAHGAIVTEWPKIIHSWIGVGVILGDATQPQLARRAPRFFNPFGD